MFSREIPQPTQSNEQLQKTLATAHGGVAVFYTAAVIAAPTKTQAPEGNHANYASH